MKEIEKKQAEELENAGGCPSEDSNSCPKCGYPLDFEYESCTSVKPAHYYCTKCGYDEG